MNTLIGKIRKIIYRNEDNGYTIALFRVKEADIKNLENTTVQLVGYFYDLKLDVSMELTGTYEINVKYNRYQFSVKNYNIIKPTTDEKIIEFLTSSFINGCGKETAKKLVAAYKDKTLEKIKDMDNLMAISGMTEKRALKINASILNYDKSSSLILKLEILGFNLEDSGKIINKYKNLVEHILENEFYRLKEIIDFKKLDNIYIQNYDKNSFERTYHTIIETMKIISFNEGHTYYDHDLVKKYLTSLFNINVSEEVYEEVLLQLQKNNEIVILENKLYLKELFDAEKNIACNLKTITDNKTVKIKNFEEKIQNLEDSLNIIYDNEQKKAIKSVFENNFAIISGGPGTGKTTILKAIVKLYIAEHKLSPVEIIEKIALIAPTGRASKKMSMATGLPAYTIHRYLKWRKDTDAFEYDEFNKTAHKLVIVDETSMVDVKLFSSLLSALRSNVKLILVGDAFQLPSVGPGKVLNNLIDSELFNFLPLVKIYRQSENSFIPYLAKEVKNKDLDEDYLTKKDDYNFIISDSTNFKKIIEKIINVSKAKGLTEENMQVLIPIYKGENGIDSINILLRNIYNPKNESKKELIFNDTVYREGDKVLQLTNDPDNNIFNGDIGYILEINKDAKKTIITINFDDNIVDIERKNLINLKHAYAISIHKSQGSEFENVIMPILNDYFIMMYNKLLYTGLSRAKTSLILVGNPNVFASGVRNDYSANRNTTLLEVLHSIFLEN